METVSFGYSEVNAIVNGFASLGDYFEAGKLTDKLDRIKVPTFFFNSEDD
jgi:predicted alpha/beta-fold hydrolase